MDMSADMLTPGRFVARAALPERDDSQWFVLDLSMVPADSVAVCPTAAKAADVQRGLELLEALRWVIAPTEVTGAPV